jgi:hypothetical protein
VQVLVPSWKALPQLPWSDAAWHIDQSAGRTEFIVLDRVSMLASSNLSRLGLGDRNNKSKVNNNVRHSCMKYKQYGHRTSLGTTCWIFILLGWYFTFSSDTDMED